MAKISNISKKKSISLSLERASTPASRMRGLMFRKKCAPLLFDFSADGIWPIHSFFVAFPFDAIYLDSSMKVADVFEAVPPFQLFIQPKSPCRYLLELPQGSARKLGANKGDKFAIGREKWGKSSTG